MTVNELWALIDVLSLGTIVYLLCDLWVWIEENWNHADEPE